MVNLPGHADLPSDVDVVGGDPRDHEFTAAVTKGARVMYQPLGLPYQKWAPQFPVLQASILAAAKAAGVRALSSGRTCETGTLWCFDSDGCRAMTHALFCEECRCPVSGAAGEDGRPGRYSALTYLEFQLEAISCNVGVADMGMTGNDSSAIPPCDNETP